MKNSKQSILLTTSTKAHWKCLGVVAAMGVGMLFLPMTASALTGHCANCHTMHNSQDGDPMAGDGLDATPNDLLLLGADCLACHSTDTAVAIDADHAPMVLSRTDPTATGPNFTLAGGNFYWVSQGAGSESVGHNVAGVAGPDPLGNVPPGGNDLGAQLTCAGTYGCHGVRTEDVPMDAISGAHHGNNAAGVPNTGADVGTSYRFLDGVQGLEDTDWEYTAADNSTNHNQYKGIDRTSDAAPADGTTISSLCAQCHPDFHNDGGPDGYGIVGTAGWGSPWARHPTDFDIGNTAAISEYRDYGESAGGAGSYIVAAPVASANVSAALATVTFNDDSIVTCISCHRAHGTEYHDLLRWDYDTLEANGIGSGEGMCKECHTNK